MLFDLGFDETGRFIVQHYLCLEPIYIDTTIAIMITNRISNNNLKKTFTIDETSICAILQGEFNMWKKLFILFVFMMVLTVSGCSKSSSSSSSNASGISIDLNVHNGEEFAQVTNELANLHVAGEISTESYTKAMKTVQINLERNIRNESSR